MTKSMYTQQGEFTYDGILADTKIPFMIKGVLLASGQGVLKKGSVIGIVTASSKGKLVNSASSDGSQTPKYVLADTVDTTSADILAECYQSGTFHKDAMVFGGTDTAATHEAAMRDLSLYMQGRI